VRGSHLFGLAMAEVRACGLTPVDRPSKWLPLTLTLSPLRKERNGERGQTNAHDLRADQQRIVKLTGRSQCICGRIGSDLCTASRLMPASKIL
jgi:hypothetical protein